LVLLVQLVLLVRKEIRGMRGQWVLQGLLVLRVQLVLLVRKEIREMRGR
jgi:hypothetical protein